jgi:hypothetical protein
MPFPCSPRDNIIYFVTGLASIVVIFSPHPQEQELVSPIPKQTPITSPVIFVALPGHRGIVDDGCGIE